MARTATVAALTAALLSCACGPAISSGRFTEMPAPRSTSEVRVFSTKLPACPYEELGVVKGRERWRSLQSVLDGMRKRAAEMGGNAIVNLRVPQQHGRTVRIEPVTIVENDGGFTGIVVRFKAGCLEE